MQLINPLCSLRCLLLKKVTVHGILIKEPRMTRIKVKNRKRGILQPPEVNQRKFFAQGRRVFLIFLCVSAPLRESFLFFTAKRFFTSLG